METGTKKFDGKAAVYQKYRPGYPATCLDYLREVCGWKYGERLADIGAGTGIFTRQLLERGYPVEAVEPCADMRGALAEALQNFPALTVREGSASATGIAGGAAAGVTAAQAFHWFDVPAFKAECRRILRPGGFVALLWNTRDPSHPLTRKAAAICRLHCPAFTGFSGGERFDEADIGFFFGGGYVREEFRNPIPMDEEGFIGRYLSASYAPGPGDKTYEAYTRDLSALFAAFAEGGRILFPNTTCCYTGRPE